MKKLFIFVLLCSVGAIHAQEVQNIDSLINKVRFDIDSLHKTFGNSFDTRAKYGCLSQIDSRYRKLDSLMLQKIERDSAEIVGLREKVSRLECAEREIEKLKFLMDTDTTVFSKRDFFDTFDISNMPEVKNRYELFYAIYELSDNIESVQKKIDDTKKECDNLGVSPTAATWNKNIGEQLDSARDIIIKIRPMDKSCLSDSQSKYYEALVDRYNEYRFMTYDVEE